MEVCPDLCVTGVLPLCIIDENAKQIIRQGGGNPAWGSINTLQGSKRTENSLTLPPSGKDLSLCLPSVHNNI